MNDEAKAGPVEADHSEPDDHSGVSRGVIAWMLAAISAAFGFLAIASCGIPFVPPASNFAIILGVMGCLAAVASVGFAFVRGQTTRATFLLVGGVLVAVNGFAIWFGRLGKHLIDYLEGH